MVSDRYGEILNGEKTYEQVASQLLAGTAVLVGWTDELGTHFDILFNLQAKVFGTNIQGGVKSNDLFVSIMRRGAFSFDLEREDTHAGYYAEKLFLSEESATTARLAEFINGVKKNINLMK